MFKKILIANRGEIAVRVIRACRDMGISPVAVYSEADRGALHVRLADEAYADRPCPVRRELSFHREDPRRSEALQRGSRSSRLWLSLRELRRLPRPCEDAGLTFIGPSPKSIALMGSKVESRKAVARYGVPMVPGTMDPVRDRTGSPTHRRFPRLSRHAQGFGRRGRKGHAARSVRGGNRRCSPADTRGSRAAFGDDAIYLEKFVEQPAAYRNSGARGHTWKRDLPRRAGMHDPAPPSKGHRRVPLAHRG